MGTLTDIDDPGIFYSSNASDGASIGSDPVITELLSALDRHDSVSADHSRRVERRCAHVGPLYFSDPKDVRSLRRRGLMHDIGKLIVPREIVSKPGELTTEEWEIMYMHPVFGRDILFPDYPGEAVAAMDHHKLGPRSYPNNGLEGAEKDRLMSLIVAMADVYDAVRNPRSYKGPRSDDDAIRVVYNNFSAHGSAVTRFLDLV